ncbi:MAG: GH3 auxin-responsive promoter family protein, partial [Nanoarchaeota archaeon]|nr:GH3 auxin-responsive promoter family protein [Nanoarchaeota archaeon]
ERTKQFRKELTLWANYTIKHRPEAIRGKIMYFAGPWKEGITKGGIPFGSISGYMAKQSPLFAKQRMVFPAEVYNILDFDEKMHRMAIIALGTTNISQIGFSSPIEVLQFFDYIEQNRERLITEIVREHPLLAQRLAKLPNFKPRSIWPNLTTINCVMGASQLPYIKLVQKRLDIKTANDPGIYASEGRITLGLSTIPRTGLLVAHENFFEFCEQQEKGFGKPLLIDQLRRGKIYKVIMTTREGLYRYDIGDLIKVVGFKEKLPLVQFVSRDKFLNIVGELSPEQVLLQAVQKIIKQEKMLISGFTFTPYTKEKKKRPQYDLLIESDQDIKQTFADKLEKELQRNILDYKQMRNEFGRLGPLRISQVKSGSYRAFEKQRRGQPKPMIIAPEEFKKQFNIIKIIEAV